ncbi:MAG: hypothetical protein Q8O00_12350 [Holophaga sp.]|nr:hypothetical protein [Holophaga sp.]
MKKALYVFSIAVAFIGLTAALLIAFNAPPAEERLEGYIFLVNTSERSSMMLKAWVIGLGGIAGGFFFAALAAIVDRLEAIHDCLKLKG